MMSPDVTAMNNRSVPFDLRHSRTSCVPHLESAASGEAIRMNAPDCATAEAIRPHKSGAALRLLSSRNTRSARRRYHGLANTCSAFWTAAAKAMSAA